MSKQEEVSAKPQTNDLITTFPVVPYPSNLRHSTDAKLLHGANF